MPISKAFGTVVICLGLTGCIGGFGSANAPRSVAVTTDQVVISGPDGFCVDPSATRNDSDTGFVLLGNCAVLAASRLAGQPVVPAVLTAAVSAPGDGGEIAGNLSALDGFFRSREGMRLLSRTQDADTMTILGSATADDVFYLHARDSSAGPVAGVQQEYWRAYLDLGRRSATLTVLGRADRDLSSEQSLSILRDFVATVQAANAVPAPEAGTGATAEISGAQPRGGLFEFDLFGGILR